MITITGKYFQTGATVTIGGVAATAVTVVNSTTITCTPPAGIGYSDVKVTNPDGYSYTLADGYGYEPVIDSVDPVSGYDIGGTNLTISGHGFISGATVTVGGNTASSIVVDSDTSITCVTPAGDVGAADVIVVNPDMLSDSLADGYEYLVSLMFTSVVPNVGSAAGSVPVVITGDGFVAGTTVTIGGNPATSIVISNPTTIACNTPAAGNLSGLGAKDIVTTTPSLQSVTAVGAYTQRLQLSYNTDGVNESASKSGITQLSNTDLTIAYLVRPRNGLYISYLLRDDPYPNNTRYSMSRTGTVGVSVGIVRIGGETVISTQAVNTDVLTNYWHIMAFVKNGSTWNYRMKRYGTSSWYKSTDGTYNGILLFKKMFLAAQETINFLQADYAASGFWTRDLYSSGELDTWLGNPQLVPSGAIHMWVPGLGDAIPTLVDRGTVGGWDLTTSNAEAGDIVTAYPGI